MTDLQPIGKILVISGIVITVIGIILWSGERLSFLRFLGRLPGDIAIEKENFKFYFPLATSILVSVVLSVIFWLLRKL
ncbi:MAG: hypothetical protein A4S09_13230 [Proteobacteria bacterium SG_bin7]|nr:MAG: hypothetical protein A4S09_13230 [Proteobacteria bacterium SG_bin7]